MLSPNLSSNLDFPLSFIVHFHIKDLPGFPDPPDHSAPTKKLMTLQSCKPTSLNNVQNWDNGPYTNHQLHLCLYQAENINFGRPHGNLAAYDFLLMWYQAFGMGFRRAGAAGVGFRQWQLTADVDICFLLRRIGSGAGRIGSVYSPKCRRRRSTNRAAVLASFWKYQQLRVCKRVSGCPSVSDQT